MPKEESRFSSTLTQCKEKQHEKRVKKEREVVQGV